MCSRIDGNQCKSRGVVFPFSKVCLFITVGCSVFSTLHVYVSMCSIHCEGVCLCGFIILYLLTCVGVCVLLSKKKKKHSVVNMSMGVSMFQCCIGDRVW